MEDKVVEHFIVSIRKNNGSTSASASSGASVETIFAYPHGNSSESEFCDSVSMLVFPHGFGAFKNSAILAPPPVHHLFGLTNSSGEHLYGASLCFYETINGFGHASASSSSAGMVQAKPGVSEKQHEQRGKPMEQPIAEDNGGAVTKENLFQAKAICFVSKRPFYTHMLRYLEQVFILGLYQASHPDVFAIEKSLCNLIHEVPVPRRGLSVQINVNDLDIVLESPTLEEFPFDLDYELMAYTFMILEPRVIAGLFHHALLEHRILIHGHESLLVTAVAETIRALLFPMNWLHVFIPNIPDVLDLSTLLEAPVPFIAGAQTSQLTGIDIPSNVVRLDLNEGKIVAEKEMMLPPLPQASIHFLNRLSNAHVPDQALHRKELQSRLWDRRIYLQKCCLSSSSIKILGIKNASKATSNEVDSNPIDAESTDDDMGLRPTTRSYFLCRKSMLLTKVIKSFTGLLRDLLQGYQDAIEVLDENNESPIGVFQRERFLDKKLSSDKEFYEGFLNSSCFQRFIALHGQLDRIQETGAASTINALSKDEESRLLFFQRSLWQEHVEGMLTNQGYGSASKTTKNAKTFVAFIPQLNDEIPDAEEAQPQQKQRKRDKASAKPDSPVVAKPRPSISMSLSTFGLFAFPKIQIDKFGEPRKVTFSSDCVSSEPQALHLRTISKSRGKSHGKDSGTDWVQSFLRNMTRKHKQQQQQQTETPIAQAPFKRSRTAEKVFNKATTSPFYRTRTLNTSKKPAVNDVSLSSSCSSVQPSESRQSIWLVATSSCRCGEMVRSLTNQIHQNKHDMEQTNMLYAELITLLGECGHLNEAKTVFDDFFSQDPLASFVSIPSHRFFWKSFSCLVDIEEEQLLDPLLGSLTFPAQVFAVEKEVMVERIYVTFGCGNIGLCLAPREKHRGCQVLSFDDPEGDERFCDGASQENSADGTKQAKLTLDCLRQNDVIETINGEQVGQWPFDDIALCLKHANRPMTVSFLRGMDKMQHSCFGELAGLESSHHQHQQQLQRNQHQRDQKLQKSNKKPRDLCDRFGLLPKKGIRISTLADCDKCSARATFAEIQQGWNKHDANDYTTKCARCGQRFVPRLCVMLGVTTAFFQPQFSSSSSLQEAQVDHFEYLSMNVIHKELANLCNKLSLEVFKSRQLRELNPRIYWNVVVKLLSLACPIDFMDLPDMTQAGNSDGDDSQDHHRQRNSYGNNASDNEATSGPEDQDIERLISSFVEAVEIKLSQRSAKASSCVADDQSSVMTTTTMTTAHSSSSRDRDSQSNWRVGSRASSSAESTSSTSKEDSSIHFSSGFQTNLAASEESKGYARQLLRRLESRFLIG